MVYAPSIMISHALSSRAAVRFFTLLCDSDDSGDVLFLRAHHDAFWFAVTLAISNRSAAVCDLGALSWARMAPVFDGAGL
jgi:hypothetical protein